MPKGKYFSMYLSMSMNSVAIISMVLIFLVSFILFIINIYVGVCALIIPLSTVSAHSIAMYMIFMMILGLVCYSVTYHYIFILYLSLFLNNLI